MNNFFQLEHKSPDCRARAGTITTSHSVIETPVFMPVGTQGTVKAIEQRELANFDYRIILGNTYHLYLRPGTAVLENFGGLHGLMNWNGSILTDSGGYQVFSLQELRKLKPDGVEFRSHIDGSKHYFTPESVVDIQRSIGSDIMMVLDECTPYPSEFSEAKKSADLSLKWAEKAENAFKNSSPRYEHSQFHFCICQGGMYPELRKNYIEQIQQFDFDGIAIGGLSVGEPAEMMYDIVSLSTDLICSDKPRYLMGVGTPENILEAVEMGIDMFDCVLPTRNARNGQLFTSRGKINLRNAKYKFSDDKIDNNIESYASNNFSLAYMRHLFIAGEILGLQLATEHNLAFYKWLMKTAREKILKNEYRQWKSSILNTINNILE